MNKPNGPGRALFLVLFAMGATLSGCAQWLPDNLDKSYLNHPGMDFEYSSTLPPQNEKTVLGSSNSQKSESGCSTCAY